MSKTLGSVVQDKVSMCEPFYIQLHFKWLLYRFEEYTNIECCALQCYYIIFCPVQLNLFLGA